MLSPPEPNPPTTTTTFYYTPPPAASSSPSPMIHESPLYGAGQDLSPLNFVIANSEYPMFPQTNAANPQPVFAPQHDLQQQETSVERNRTDAVSLDTYYPQHTSSERIQDVANLGIDAFYLSELLNYDGNKLRSSRDNEIDGSSAVDNMNVVALPNQTPNSTPCASLDPLNMRAGRVNDPIEYNTSVNYFPEEHHEVLLNEDAGGEHDKGIFTCQPLPSSVVSFEASSNRAGLSRSMPSEVIQASDHHHGTRGHLKFDPIADNHISNETQDAANMSSPAGQPNFRSLNQSPVQPGEISRMQQAVFLCYYDTNLNSFMAAPLPMDLNRIVRLLINKHNGIYYSNGDANTCERENQLQRQAAVQLGSAISASTSVLQPVPDSAQTTQFGEQSALCEEGTPVSQEKDTVKELEGAGSQRNRKRTKATSTETDGCRRCKCRMSKCMQLYCECFTAERYCLESCGCENCLNKPEHEAARVDARNQIQARNPVAFAPKVIKHATVYAENMLEKNLTAPTSARHKTGCNCRRSKCLNGYCECYKSGVGCSKACRCEGCNNSFGRNVESLPSLPERVHESTRQQSPAMEVLRDVSNLTPLSNAQIGRIFSPNNMDGSRVSHGQLHQGSSLHQMDCGTPKMLDKAYLAMRNAETCSGNFQYASPPQIQSKELISSSPQKSRIVKTFKVHDVPHFPSLTPHKKPNDANHQPEANDKSRSSSQSPDDLL